jgi:hypothetical protein
VPISGRCAVPGATLEALFTRVGGSEDVTTAFAGAVSQSGEFSGTARLSAGWYSLRILALKGGSVVAEHHLARVGVGEVFIVMGHSVAQGGELDLPGAHDDRVQTIALRDAITQLYEKSANPADLPPLVGSQFATGVKPAPFGHGPYFWARFAEELAQREGVPVLLLNAGFGGTTLSHWAKSARGESFEHSFVRSDLQMPYANLRNGLRRYAKHLGLRAILSDHGQNDAPETRPELIFQNYTNVIAQARADLAFPELAVVVNRQTPFPNERHIREAQERVIREVRHCFPGPDYDTLSPEDRPDRIHLGIAGMEKAASLWVRSVSPKFFEVSKPFTP